MFKVNTFYRLRNGYVGLRPYSSANFLMKEFTEPFEVLEVNNDGWVLAIRTSKGEIYTSCLSEKQGIKIAYDVILFDTEIKNYIECPNLNTHVHEVPWKETKKNGPHEYTKVETPHGDMWRHNSPFGSKGTFAQPSKPYDDEKYIVVFLSEQGTQDRGCQRSGLLSELEAHNQARKFVEKNPGSEALVMKAITQYITAQPVVHPVEINFVK